MSTVRALFDVFIAAFLLTCSITAALALGALWRLLDTDWNRRPRPARRPSGRQISGAGLAWLLVAGGLIAAAPWGHDTALYVIGLGGSLAIAIVVLTLVWAVVDTVGRSDPPRPPRPRRLEAPPTLRPGPSRH